MRNCLFICALAFIIPAHANLINNGSFESPTVPEGGFTDFLSGSTSINGWTVVGPEASIVSATFSFECCVFPAEDGARWLDLTGDGSDTVEGVQQIVATIPGTEYTLSFWVGNVFDPGGIFGITSSVDVRLGGTSGTSLGVFTNASTTRGTQVWQQFVTSFTATGSSATLDFLNADPNGDNSNGLDNVVLTASTTDVPEPCTLSLMVLAIIGAGLMRRHH
jgi:hypothetical protein